MALETDIDGLSLGAGGAAGAVPGGVERGAGFAKLATVTEGEGLVLVAERAGFLGLAGEGERCCSTDIGLDSSVVGGGRGSS